MRVDYRADIDGLRAVAVSSVVLFHAFPKVLPGGFVGVDLFFVISGFLITGILSREMAAGTYSLGAFYARRVRRIFPAMVLVLASVLIFGKISLLRAEFNQLLESCLAGIGFAANVYFWHTANYFDGDALTKPLLHLWSLGVEEQFYIGWPLLLGVCGLRARKAWAVLGGCALLSFAINLYLTRWAPSAAFYLPFGRMWQLAAGGLGALWISRNALPLAARSGLSAIGLGLIGWSLLYCREAGFPGWQSVAPTLGSLMVLVAGGDAWPNRWVLARSLPRAVGLISYPLYLWHWPLLSFPNIVFGELSRVDKIIAVAASFVLAALTYLGVERRIQRVALPRFHVSAALGAVLALLGLVAGSLRFALAGSTDAQSRFIAYYKDYPVAASVYSEDHFECSFLDNVHNTVRATLDDSCTPAAHGLAQVMLWGDSHAQHLRHGIESLVGSPRQVLQVTTFGCGPTIDVGDGRSACDASNRFALQLVERVKPAVIVIAQRADHDRTDWDAVALALKRLGAGQVVLVGPVPQWKPFLYRSLAFGDLSAFPSRLSTGLDRQIDVLDRALAQKYAASRQIIYVSPWRFLCDPSGCLTTVPTSEGGGFPMLTTFDYGHFTLAASTFVAQRLLTGPLAAALRSDFARSQIQE